MIDFYETSKDPGWNLRNYRYIFIPFVDSIVDSIFIIMEVNLPSFNDNNQ